MSTIVLVLLSFLVLPLSASAAGDFVSRYDVTYKYDALGKATVEHKISLTNTKSQVYASAYQLLLSGEIIQNIAARDEFGALKPIVDQKGETTAINLSFNQPIVGRDKTLRFTITYQTTPANHRGQVWEISLPKLAQPELFDEYQLNLVVPTVFGSPAFISPSPAASESNTYIFTKDQISKLGVVAAFGNFQTYGFDLKYQLHNSGFTKANLQIAIPADTNSQRVFYETIVPKPTTIKIDPDGNWLASFSVAGRSTQEVTLIGQARILAEPILPIGQTDPSELALYLQATPSWPSTDPTIVALAHQLRTPQAIYDYVKSTLSYDYSRIAAGVTRKGALEALASPISSLCTEFTDLFIAIARAAGIPAREVNGYAYSQDPKLQPLSRVANVYHAWPQYWDEVKKTWVSIDPTWGNTSGGIDYFTKLDFNHIAFVIHGISDTAPALQASGVNVFLQTYKEHAEVNPVLTWHSPWQIWPKLTNTGTLTVANNQGSALHRLPISTISYAISSKPAIDYIDTIPPFSSVDVPIGLTAGWQPVFDPASLSISVGQQSMTYNIGGKLFIVWQLILGILFASIIIAIAATIYKAWSVYLQRH